MDLTLHFFNLEALAPDFCLLSEEGSGDQAASTGSAAQTQNHRRRLLRPNSQIRAWERTSMCAPVLSHTRIPDGICGGMLAAVGFLRDIFPAQQFLGDLVGRIGGACVFRGCQAWTHGHCRTWKALARSGTKRADSSTNCQTRRSHKTMSTSTIVLSSHQPHGLRCTWSKAASKACRNPAKSTCMKLLTSSETPCVMTWKYFLGRLWSILWQSPNAFTVSCRRTHITPFCRRS